MGCVFLVVSSGKPRAVPLQALAALYRALRRTKIGLRVGRGACAGMSWRGDM